jgi:hypothetical protein
MRKILVGLVLSFAAAACSSSSNSAAVPEGNWDVTLTFLSGGTCTGLPATFDINFDITDDGNGGYNLAARTGLTGDTVGGTMDCSSVTECELQFTDSGPGTEDSNVDTQTISADLVEDNADQVSGTGTINFILDDTTSCTVNFDGDGDVV